MHCLPIKTASHPKSETDAKEEEVVVVVFYYYYYRKFFQLFLSKESKRRRRSEHFTSTGIELHCTFGHSVVILKSYQDESSNNTKPIYTILHYTILIQKE
jgi:hypothetical protein